MTRTLTLDDSHISTVLRALDALGQHPSERIRALELVAMIRRQLADQKQLALIEQEAADAKLQRSHTWSPDPCDGDDLPVRYDDEPRQVDIIRAKEVARLFGVDPATVARWCRNWHNDEGDKRLPSIKIGKTWHVLLPLQTPSHWRIESSTTPSPVHSPGT